MSTAPVASSHRGVARFRLKLMGNEPVSLMGAINAAITATLGVLTITEVLSPEVAGAVGVALAAWILVAATFITRPKVVGPAAQADPGVAKALTAYEAKKAA